MKKALDYVSDYQLKSACKDAICIAPSKFTQIIFAVLEDWYHHIVLTHSCKLVSFLHIYLLFYWQMSGNEPDACKKRYSRIRHFTFYLFNNNNIYMGKSNQAARKGTGPSKLATQKSNKENAPHAQKNIQNRNMLSISI